MSIGNTYKFNEYSIFDIIEYLEGKNYTVKFYQEGDKDENYLEWKKENKPDDHWERGFAGSKIGVVGTDVYIDIPKMEEDIYKEMPADGINVECFASLRFENFPKTKYYDESKKVYEMLKRKFGMKKIEKKSKMIKDWDKIQGFVKEYSK